MLIGVVLQLLLQLIPLYVCVGLGCCGAALYTLRLAVRSPEVSWNKKTNPEPWNEYANKQHKVKSSCISDMLLGPIVL